MNVLLTGSTGFLGRRLKERLSTINDLSLSLALRSYPLSSGGQDHIVGDISGETDWSSALIGQQVVIHTAARSFVDGKNLFDSFLDLRRVNVEGTLHLAKQAVAAGVKRFIFISSIKVNGESTSLGRPFLASDVPAPEDAYGLSKLEAEQGLMRIAAGTTLEVVIIRPPMVYGPGAKGNFASMMRVLEKGFPLPFGSIHNFRSLIGIDNLVDLIVRCIEHPCAANQLLLASDGEDLSTTQLLRSVTRAMGRSSRLIPVPARLLRVGAILIGKRAVAQRLLGSLQVDISHTCELLDWMPPFTVEEGLRRCFVKRD